MIQDFTLENIKAADNTDNEFIRKFIERINKTEELSQQLVSNTEYVLWLEKFTVSNPGFVDDEWLYCPEKISKEDYEKVDMLQYFLIGIRNYASSNYISMEGNCNDYHFFFKFNGIGYEIGSVSGQGTFTYCHREAFSPDKHFIDFNDIMSNKKQNNVDSIVEKLNALDALVNELLNLGTPEDTILSRVSHALDNYEDDTSND